MSTFAEIFCQRFRVAPDRYVSAIFWRCLHRRTLLLVPFLRMVSPDYFAADFDLIRSVGRLKFASGLPSEVEDFRAHPTNRDFARRTLKLRVSARRLACLVNEALPRRAA